MYPIAPDTGDCGSPAMPRQCAVLPSRPMGAEQSRQSKAVRDRVIDRLLPQRR